MVSRRERMVMARPPPRTALGGCDGCAVRWTVRSLDPISQRFLDRTGGTGANNPRSRLYSADVVAFPPTLQSNRTLVQAHRRRARATPNRNAIIREPRGASRAILLRMLNGIPGLRPASIAPLTRLTVPFTASETSAMVDFGSRTGSRPS